MEHPRDASPADEQTEKLLANIEESQLGFRHNLQGPHGPRRGEFAHATPSDQYSACRTIAAQEYTRFILITNN